MTLTTTVLLVILAILCLAMLLAAIRLVIGPTLADRVVALDLLSISGIALMSIGAIMYDLESMLDVAILVGLVGFIGTAAFATYIERVRS